MRREASTYDVQVETLQQVEPLKQCNLNILYINARSIKNKIDEIETICALLKEIDVIVAVETWLTENITPFINIRNFNAEHVCRTDKKGGGVSVFIKSSLKHEQLKSSSNTCEMLSIQVTKGKTSLNVIGIYNPNVFNLDNLINEISSFLGNHRGPTYVIGDFNVNLLEENAQNIILSSIMESYGLKIINQCPTRITERTATLIDHIYSNMDMQEKIVNINSSGATTQEEGIIRLDHNILLICKPTDLHTEKNRIFPTLRKINYTTLKHSLKEFKVNRDGEVDDEYSRFISYFQESCSKASAVNTYKSKENYPHAPWIDREYLQLVRTKEKLFNMRKKNKGNCKILQDYKACRNAVTSMKKKKKAEYYSTKLQDSNDLAKNLWTVAKEALYNQKGKKETCSGELSPENFNEKFINTVSGLIEKESRKKRPENNSAPLLNCQTRFRLHPTTKEEISKYIDGLKNKSNITFDKINNKTIKMCKEDLVTIVCDLQMAEDMGTLMAWMEANSLFINFEKNNYIIFKKPATVTTNLPSFNIQHHTIFRTNTAKFLGLTIDENLLWEDHINNICKKIAPIIGVTHRLKNFLTPQSKRTIYFGLIQSHLNYMAAIWGTATASRMGTLKILQKRAIKTLFGYNIRTDSRQIFKETGILPLDMLINATQAKICHSIIFGLRQCNTNFNRNQDFHNYNTRSTNIRAVSSHSTTYGLRSAYNSIAHSFNQLPHELKSVTNPNTFKIKLNIYYRTLLNAPCTQTK
ncbi:RNA-directed DNA polymerase from mobile element jockey [Frankliniella fusca]|uniref:RNA-directed DNA polymerase from mobile element jockey n=1 Tax=Frankliniella fusca TaxID=407009 RepID=A0AAE1GQJ5_9NEOP|nr:RNA-directed DNA polymerase from mobile element jockey [Frankliniella fusca]